MTAIVSAKCEPLDLSQPMESTFLEAFADILGLDDLPVTIKLEEEERSWPGSPDTESTGLRVATPVSLTSTDHNDMNRCKEEPSTVQIAAESKRARRSAMVNLR